MSGASCSSWDSDEFFTDDETIIEYLTDALEESDPLIFLKAARNVARARASPGLRGSSSSTLA